MKKKQLNKKGSVSNEILWILILIAGAIMVSLMEILIIWKTL